MHGHQRRGSGRNRENDGKLRIGGKISPYGERSNSRLDEIQAAFLSLKLKGLDEDNSKRRSIADKYCEEIDNPRIALPQNPKDESHVWHIFAIRCEERDRLQLFLEKKEYIR